ncbi:uncharacterized protein LOC116844481 [Odontomachus brunneus]|uniref:uncharacterized protein LOC116844481 n=1 Tax=Odontomachus brunneus TaxID=486640 RepID=UPI0013F19ADD|nr:uncharacterized protein LOC116844481 [Odontomachus brunneus]XP_032671923.1 uncharacterized protein LOC116844481 [Odontomachus brunneus]
MYCRSCNSEDDEKPASLNPTLQSDPGLCGAWMQTQRLALSANSKLRATGTTNASSLHSIRLGCSDSPRRRLSSFVEGIATPRQDSDRAFSKVLLCGQERSTPTTHP